MDGRLASRTSGGIECPTRARHAPSRRGAQARWPCKSAVIVPELPGIVLATWGVMEPDARGDPRTVPEKSISELMIPASAYRRVDEDEPVQRVVRTLLDSLFPVAAAGRVEPGHRSVLVYSRAGAFLGCIRLNDILEFIVPPGESERAPCERGMLAARCSTLADVTVGEILGEQRFVEIEAPLMEAVQLIVFDGLINIPVLREGELVGILTDRDVLREICRHVAEAAAEAEEDGAQAARERPQRAPGRRRRSRCSRQAAGERR